MTLGPAVMRARARACVCVFMVWGLGFSVCTCDGRESAGALRLGGQELGFQSMYLKVSGRCNSATAPLRAFDGSVVVLHELAVGAERNSMRAWHVDGTGSAAVLGVSFRKSWGSALERGLSVCGFRH